MHPYLLIHQTFDRHHLSACQRGTDSTTTRTVIDAQLQLGHHLLSIQPHLEKRDELQLRNIFFIYHSANHVIYSRSVLLLLYKSTLSVSTGLRWRIDRLLLAHVLYMTTKLLQTLSTTLGANFFTASPTERNILSSPIMSMNLAERSFWITAGPGLARTSCK